MARKYLDQTRIAGVQYHEALFCRDKMQPGCELRIERDENNKYDPEAVALYCGEHKVGYIPKGENKLLALLLEQGWGEILEVYVYNVDLEQHPEHQYTINIYVKSRE
ncbi:MAG: HIRAN domain-containing protein [Bacteroidia bacterium]|nr:HIRAN domain-containing protein [Bacteroidia bacterium]